MEGKRSREMKKGEKRVPVTTQHVGNQGARKNWPGACGKKKNQKKEETSTLLPWPTEKKTFAQKDGEKKVKKRK